MGASETVFQNPQHPYTQSLLKAALHLQDIENKQVNPILQTAKSSPQPLLSIKNLQQHYTLESGFIQQLFF